ncbi:pyridoxine/pyridoxamine 5'-phosphate oxidase [Virgibacillus litoralis]|uniref:Pyridoxamine 5'-phosphate oxidase n=1 Tax=Virgibacillus litoralis TaxID=578221 RepID=A0ABS4H862_9BACI|nr:pyridoxal 5'-phosphate synthase [Virgibacillus litoralis]MBP1947107.1 pyridoxamine 5'-phosphate oxidase [Virgibacillus litoralis]
MKQARDLLSNLKSLAGPLPEFHPNEITNNPSDLFLQWLNTAIEEGVNEPHAMTLSTVDAEGAPDARVLILKDVTRDRWYFATSLASRKGEQLHVNQKVALTFYWSEIGRQVRIRGVASEMTKERNTEDFLKRSSAAQAMALIGNQSKTLDKREDLESELLKTKDLVNQTPKTISPNWKLFAVLADEIEFWQGDPERKHMRVQYKRNGEQWKHRLLWP